MTCHPRVVNELKWLTLFTGWTSSFLDSRWKCRHIVCLSPTPVASLPTSATFQRQFSRWICLQYSDAVGRQEEHPACKKIVIWLSDSSEVQMICIWSSWCHCHLIISCFIKIQIGLTFLVLAYPGYPGKKAVKRVSVCLYFATAVHKRTSRDNWHRLTGQIPGKITHRPHPLLLSLDFCLSDFTGDLGLSGVFSIFHHLEKNLSG